MTDHDRTLGQQRRAFHAHAGVFAGGMTVIFLVNLFTNLAAGITGEWSAWWSAWALLGWSLGLGVHGLVVALNRTMPRSSSEEHLPVQAGELPGQPLPHRRPVG